MLLITIGSLDGYLKVEKCWPNLWSACFATQMYYTLTVVIRAISLLSLLVDTPRTLRADRILLLCMDTFFIPTLAVWGTLALWENRAEKCCETYEIHVTAFAVSVLVITVIGGYIISLFFIMSWKEICTEATIQPGNYLKS